MRTSSLTLAVLASLLVSFPALASQETPAGWHLKGTRAKDYTAGTDTSVTRANKPSAYLESTVDQMEGFGTITQTFNALDYIGKRMKLTGWIKTEHVKDTAGLWMRVDGDRGRIFGFDNMENRLIRGSNDWKEYKIVLDVPSGARSVKIGFLLHGPGKAWVNSLRFVQAGPGEKSTNMWGRDKLASGPVNLDFTQKPAESNKKELQ